MTPLIVLTRWWRMLLVYPSDCWKWLDVLIAVHKAVTAVVTAGLHSKNVMVRICVAFLLLHVVKSLGAHLFFSSCRETVHVLLRAEAELLEDGNLDVRWRDEYETKVTLPMFQNWRQSFAENPHYSWQVWLHLGFSNKRWSKKEEFAEDIKFYEIKEVKTLVFIIQYSLACIVCVWSC